MRQLIDILEPGQDMGEFLIKCRMDFKYFGERVMGLEIMPYHEYWIQCYLENRRTCFTAPRGSGKTFVLGVAFSIWVSMFKTDKKFLIVAAGKDKAQDIIKEIRSAIEGNELLDAMLTPSGKSTLWSTKEMKTKTNCMFIVRAYTGKGIRGQHVDYVLLDEAGEIEGKDTKLYFDGIVPTVTHKQGHIMVIGTPKTDNDLLSVISEPQRGYHCRTYTMWDEEREKSLWPSRFSKKELDRLREEQGIITFRREYMCQRIDEGVQPFNMKDIVRAYDKDKKFRNAGEDYKEKPEDDEDWGTYFLGVDLAMSPQGDYSVYTIVELVDETLIIQNIIRVQGIHYKSQEEMVRQLWSDFRPLRIIVDKSVFGDIFISDLRDMGIPAEPFTFTPDNRNLILNNLMRLFENNKIVIPRYSEDSECFKETTNLTEELQKIIFGQTLTGLRTFKSVGKHDDSVMAFALAAWAATESGPESDYAEAIVSESVDYVHGALDTSFAKPDFSVSPY